MADIELVIKMPEDEYNIIKKSKRPMTWAEHLIANGTPLPKGHGRLIDVDAFERRCMFDSSIEDMQDVIYALRDYKPIIEADKSEIEPQENEDKE